jgi:hypothetical protein
MVMELIVELPFWMTDYMKYWLEREDWEYKETKSWDFKLELENYRFLL